VDTRNEAYAFASCADCAAVAVGFQVVLIVGQADVLVPENLSAAANYNCVGCLTYALASQLVLTLDGPLSEGGMARLNTLWQEIAGFGRRLQDVPLSEIQGRLTAYKEQLMELIRNDPSASKGTAAPGTEPAPGSTATPGSGGSGPAVPTPGPTPVPAPATEPASPGAPAPGSTAPGSTVPAPAPTPSATTDSAADAPGPAAGMDAATPSPAAAAP
jgi:putative peptide zinc metalloprotease protein